MLLTEPTVLGSALLGFTDRHGGVSGAPYDSLNLADHVGDVAADVDENRRRVAAVFGVDRLTTMNAVHGADVAVIAAASDADAAAVPMADAMVTALPGVALTALAADCVPVLLVDPAAGVIGVAHAGRRGVVADVVGAAVVAMTGLGAVTQRTVALIGPAICAHCYEVGDDVFAATVAAAPVAAARSASGGLALDLRRAIASRLDGMGVAATLVGGCTAEGTQLYSHRRDGVTGRFAAIAVLR